MNKTLIVVQLGCKAMLGMAAGYFAYRALEEKAEELLEDGGVVNAIAIGVGHVALSSAAGAIAFVALG